MKIILSSRTLWSGLVALFVLLNAVAEAGFAHSAQQSAGSGETSQPPPPPPAHLSPEEATDVYLSRLTDVQRERSDSYFEGGYWLQLFGFLYGLATAWVWLGFRWAARLRDLAERITRFRFARDGLFVVVFLIGDYALSFPLSVYEGYFREHHYGLATQSFGPWMGDQLTGLMVGAFLGAIACSLLYTAIRKTGARWWIWGAAGGTVFIAVVSLLAPVFIAPLFNSYTPLQDAAVRESLLQIAQANGIPVEEVYQFDASRQTTRISANVSGFLDTLRISLNDNLLNRCSLPEIEAVMAHEMGHYVLNHVYESILFFAVILLVGFGLVHAGFERVMSGWGERFGIRALGDIASLPLLGVLLSAYFFVLTPAMNTMVRTNESEADIFGLNAARQPDGFAEVSLKLGEYRKLAPGYWEELLFFDHPSGRTRILMAMTWKHAHASRAKQDLGPSSGNGPGRVEPRNAAASH